MADMWMDEFDEAVGAVDSTLGDWLATIDGVLLPALSGDRLATRAYAHAFVEMSEVMCGLVASEPARRTWLLRVSRREAISLPFRACWLEDGAGLSVAMTLLGDLRRMLPEAPNMERPTHACRPLAALVELDDQQVATFERLVDQIIDSSVSPLEEIIATFDLSYTDAGRLFGVSRQAISQWLSEGIPAERQAKAVTIAQTATLLRRNLVDERVPGISRKPAERYGGRSMLEMIADDDHLELLEITRASFDWARSA